jgi:hypothetical protein
MLALPLLLTACATAKPAPPKQIPCPVLPALDPPIAVEKSFTERMESFLLGSLPKPTGLKLPSTNVTDNTTPQGKSKE